MLRLSFSPTVLRVKKKCWCGVLTLLAILQKPIHLRRAEGYCKHSALMPRRFVVGEYRSDELNFTYFGYAYAYTDRELYAFQSPDNESS